ncbi:MAG: decaprenyl-phosphate phosphoribosyltransferase [Chloroflexi bacterium]|nr:decaprenyl-phosphate phosphoribosyltransferase [Chloroflexota bacterium]MCY3938111.1 decaprenyl-phosphate phosphoribosyltransferase [Chloroflexota bacterium]
MLNHYWTAARPSQWIKNLFVLAPLVFAQRLDQPRDILLVLATFALFCLLASGIYLINDAIDAPRDRSHPLKRNRPVAAGRIGRIPAVAAGLTSVVAALVLAYFIAPTVSLVLGIYAVQNLLYSALLKSIALIDVVVIAVGFVLRAVSGAVAIDVPFSVWLLMCTFFVALVMGAAKRISEIESLGEATGATRPALARVHPQVLNSLLAAATAATLVSYSLYTVAAETVAKVGGKALVLTTPFVVYGLIRYLQRVYGDADAENPAAILLKDRGMQVVIGGWGAVVLAIIYGFSGDLGGLFE